MANKQIKVTLAKSLAGQLKNIQASVRGLGLRRPHQTVEVFAGEVSKANRFVSQRGSVLVCGLGDRRGIVITDHRREGGHACL